MTTDGTVPAAGNDPDTLRRAAKVKAAAARSKAAEPEDDDEPKARPTKVQGRSTTPLSKAK